MFVVVHVSVELLSKKSPNVKCLYTAVIQACIPKGNALMAYTIRMALQENTARIKGK